MEHNNRVEAALFRQLIANWAIPLLGSALGSSLVTVAQWGWGNRHLALAWLGLVYAVTALRIGLTWRCRQRLEREGYVHSQATAYALSTALSGFAWGLGGLMVQNVEPVALVITVTAVQAMVMGGVLTLGAFLPSFLAFALPALLPMVVALAAGGGAANWVLASYSLIFLFLMVGIAIRFNKSLRHTWQVTFEKEDLVTALTEAHDRLAILAETDGLTGLDCTPILSPAEAVTLADKQLYRAKSEGRNRVVALSEWQPAAASNG